MAIGPFGCIGHQTEKITKVWPLPLSPDVLHRPLPATEARKRLWAVATMFALLEPLMKPLHAN